MMLLAILWSAFAPFLTSAVLAILGWTLHSKYSFGQSRPLYITVSITLGWIIILGQHWMQRHEFNTFTRQLVVVETSSTLPYTNLIVLDSGTANSFGSRYVQEGFIVEHQEYPTSDQRVRVQRNENGDVTTQRIREYTASAKIRESHTEYSNFGVITIEAIYQEKTVAKHYLAHFNGSGLPRVALLPMQRSVYAGMVRIIYGRLR